MTPSEMSERITALNAAIIPLCEERARLKQTLLELRAEFKVGQTIAWNGGTRKGVIERIFEWVGAPAYTVRRIKKDGTLGGEVDVLPYHGAKPA